MSEDCEVEIENDEAIQVPEYRNSAVLLGEGFGDDEDDMLAAAIAASMEQMKIDEDSRKEETDEKAYLMECMVQPEENKNPE